MREQLRQIKLWKVIFAAVGILLVGTGVAFNARAALGNDPSALSMTASGTRRTLRQSSLV